MSEHKKVRNVKQPKQHKKAKVRKDDSDFPVEVIVYDCVKHERCVAEYRGESKWWFGTRLYKVYHPNFVEPVTAEQPVAYRWVTKLGKSLGTFDPNEPVATQDEAQA